MVRNRIGVLVSDNFFRRSESSYRCFKAERVVLSIRSTTTSGSGTHCQCEQSVSETDSSNSQMSETRQSHSQSEPRVPGELRHNKVLIVGLGNHGMNKTRHNVGMQFVDRLATLLDISWSREKSVNGMVASRSFVLKDCTTDLLVMKPKALMNVNGRSVAKAVRFYNPDQIYLVHDDLDKDLGKFGLKERGSARGHNGVRSVFGSLRTEEIPRLRLGIGRPAHRDDVTDHVLGTFTTEEEKEVEDVIRRATWILLRHIEHNVLDNSRQELVKQIKATER